MLLLKLLFHVESLLLSLWVEVPMLVHIHKYIHTNTECINTECIKKLPYVVLFRCFGLERVRNIGLCFYGRGNCK